MKMKKLDYQTPMTEVINYEQQACLLAGSLEAGRESYGLANSDVDENELDTDEVWNWE